MSGSWQSSKALILALWRLRGLLPPRGAHQAPATGPSYHSGPCLQGPGTGESLGYGNPLFSHPSERSLNSSFTRSSEAEDGTCVSPNCPEREKVASSLQGMHSPGGRDFQSPFFCLRLSKGPRTCSPIGMLDDWGASYVGTLLLVTVRLRCTD